jgi:hypothetical protein
MPGHVAGRSFLLLAVDVGARIRRILQDGQDLAAAGHCPDHVMRRRPAQGTRWQQQVVLVEIAHDGFGRFQVRERVEDQAELRLNFFVGMQEHVARP